MAANKGRTVDKEAAAAPKVEAVKLEPRATYTVVGTGTSRHMPAGSEHSVSGANAMILIEAGRATLKEK